MMFSPCVSILFLLISILTINSVFGVNPTEDCLKCICSAGSGKCDLNYGCQGDYCGPLAISWAFWSDGGNLGGGYKECTEDLDCAIKTTKTYFKRYEKDCNDDGKVDCDDFAGIHNKGPGGCVGGAAESTPFWDEYKKCTDHPLMKVYD